MGQLRVSEAAREWAAFGSPDQLIFEDGRWRVEATDASSNIYFSPPQHSTITFPRVDLLSPPPPPNFQIQNLAACCICLDALREVVVFPCLHLATCRRCHDRLERRCCVCRSNVLGFICVVLA